VPEVVLDELKAGAGIEQVRGDRVAQRVARQAGWQAGGEPIAHESRLNLPPTQRARTSLEEWCLGVTVAPGQVDAQQRQGPGEQDLLAPESALEASHEQSSALEIHVTTPKQEHLSHAKAVVVHEREQRSVADVMNGAEELLQLRLREIAGWLLVGMRKDGQGGRCDAARDLITARNSRKAQCAAKARETGVFVLVGGQPQAIRRPGTGSNAAESGVHVPRSLGVRGSAKGRTFSLQYCMR